ncbi:Spherulation-specific family 4-domain-containing protein [Cladorrhinum sp. PSN332]|nr:Spherulation-specific family 4-domain-containing protein [Cladorrhinum sp. PSN332]
MQPKSPNDDLPKGFGSDMTRPPRLSRRHRLTLSAIGVVVLIAVALGVGLGLGLKHHGDDDDDDDDGDEPVPTFTTSPAPIPTAIWEPRVNSSWQIILNSVLDIDPNNPSVQPDVEVYDIDMFGHQNTMVIPSLHKLGKRVICYFSAGSYEPDRPDSSQFQSSDIGKDLKGWPGERWLDIRSTSIRNIMASRIEIASKMGCDAVDPDNLDGYQNDNGKDLTSADSADFAIFLANEAHKWNLAIGLKNAGEIVKAVLPQMQFAVNEQCAQYDNCAMFSPFIDANKPVFHIEYPDGAPRTVSATDQQEACSAPGANGFSTIIKGMNLAGWAQYCDGRTVETKLQNTMSSGPDSPTMTARNQDTPPRDTSTANNLSTQTRPATHPFILVPLYIYPASGSWSPLFRSVSQHPDQDFLVVVNPNNGPGPGDLPDANYTSVLESLSSFPNVKLLGYVYCSYGRRQQSEIVADINSYQAWHSKIRIDGIFFDEAPSTPEHVNYMSSASSTARSVLLNPPKLIIYNPGVFPQSHEYYDSADYIVPFENGANQWDSDYVQINLQNLSPELRAKSVVIAHSSSGWDQHVKIVEEAVGKQGFAGHFVTGVGGYTEWCGLWSEYVSMTAERERGGPPKSGESATTIDRQYQQKQE